MTRRVLLDANMLIGGLDNDPGNAEHQASRQLFEELMADENVEVVVSPLTRYEVLCGIKRIPAADVEAALDAIEHYSVTEAEADRAAELFRLYKDRYEVKSQPMNRYKRAFDLFYCACLEVNGLEPCSRMETSKIF
ncbi:MAG: PIN domain-containing protein [Candidatus Accumulibacter sp.]|jgi:predicted nucleic acid-binding protein|nr:PIN domain-containing protein [Accumulibacter sp.]